MQISIQEALKNKIEAYQNNTLEKQVILDGKEYQKKWADAIQHFQVIINKERVREKQSPLSFMAIRQKLVALREIDDLRWFYMQCLKYSKKEKGNTFSRCFFGALKIR